MLPSPRARPLCVVRAGRCYDCAIDASFFRDRDLRGRALLVHTGWDVRWATPAYADGHPYLTEDAAAYLRDCGVALVGIDSMNIDDTRGRSRPVHSILLGAGILIVEHLCNMAAVPDEGFEFSAVRSEEHTSELQSLMRISYAVFC